MSKRWRNDQSRMGRAERRRLEFNVVTDQIARRREAFQQRLQRRIRPVGECFCFDGTLDHKGYARMNFRFKGEHVSIHAHRVFLIMKLGRPIRLGYEAGHLPACEHRTCVAHLREEHYKTNCLTNLSH